MDVGTITKNNQGPSEEASYADMNTDYSDLIKDEAFIGDIPYANIIEGIQNQFINYIGTDDHTNYVETFYKQIHDSYNEIDDEEEHPVETREALDQILTNFVSTLGALFERRLSITLMDLEAESFDQDDLEYEITVLYNYFILNARENFRTVIVKDILTKLKTTDIMLSDRQFYKKIDDLMVNYSPLVTAVGPMEFIRSTGNQEVYEMFEDGRVVGNFLRKYSPRFFDFEDYQADIVADIVMKMEVKAELQSKIKGG